MNNTTKANVELQKAHDQIVALRLTIAAFWDRLDSDIQQRLCQVDTLEIK